MPSIAWIACAFKCASLVPNLRYLFSARLIWQSRQAGVQQLSYGGCLVDAQEAQIFSRAYFLSIVMVIVSISNGIENVRVPFPSIVTQLYETLNSAQAKPLAS